MSVETKYQAPSSVPRFAASAASKIIVSGVVIAAKFLSSVVKPVLLSAFTVQVIAGSAAAFSVSTIQSPFVSCLAFTRLPVTASV